MSSKTKIVVLKSRELIYTGIFILLGILLILLLFYMFSPDDKKDNQTGISSTSSSQDQISVSTEYLENGATENTTEEAQETFSGYVPGVYSSELNLGGSTLQLSVSVDQDRVTGVSIDNMDETLTAMYPLVQPSLDEINSQIGMVSSVNDITYSSDNKYTTILILEAINNALNDAKK
ncbi:MAG: hypothetical protein IKJ73_03885 [Lachnospiraceae bacterium]|nr:hypothetical protein [Lachnospiraceae bacterium]